MEDRGEGGRGGTKFVINPALPISPTLRQKLDLDSLVSVGLERESSSRLFAGGRVSTGIGGCIKIALLIK